MSKKGSERGGGRSDDSSELPVLRRIARLMEMLVRLHLQAMRGDRTQREMILMLDSAGCGPSEIAQLVGTTPNTVNVALSNAKKKRRRSP